MQCDLRGTGSLLLFCGEGFHYCFPSGPFRPGSTRLLLEYLPDFL